MEPLDLSKNVMLERFKLIIDLTRLPIGRGWVCRMLQTVTSPAFNELVIWSLYGWRLWDQQSTGSWEDLDALLSVLAERNPDFRVVFRAVPPQSPQSPHDIWHTCEEVRSLTTSCLPLASLMGLLKFEHAHDAEDIDWKMDCLDLNL